MMWWRTLWIVVALMLGAAQGAHGHEVRPALFNITESRDGAVTVLFKQPSAGLQAVRLEPRISGGVLEHAPTAIEAGTGFQARLWRDLRLDGPLGGRTVEVDGLDRSITDVLLNVTFADGHQTQTILRPHSSSLVLAARGDTLPIARYFTLGVEHILTGYDHLLFVLGLVLLVHGRWRIVKTITAFTVAHSITLGVTALGFVSLDSGKIEILVALSIVFLALELINAARGVSTLTQKWPWLIAFAFGLLHGAAFAGALAEVGLPRANIPGALLLFNLGVEAGQIAFVAIVLAARWALEWALPSPLLGRVAAAPAYLIGISATYWVFERFHAAI